ncbi:flagellar basal body-associated FliL family protein [Aeromonas aquatica]|uniref:flagellar basal body-associated FliL family protein n=1 Tax=Aeromonas aquatica TaxID=558964 RepID=UPI000FADFCF1|nr:flagellar basal body-associated FliL family protein [Aeromonas aquatica]
MKKIVIILIAVLLLLGGGYASLTMGGATPLLKQLNALAGQSEPAPEQAPKELQIYNIIKVLLTVPDQANARLHHVQLDLALTSFNPKATAKLEKLDPLLRSVLVETFASKNFDQLKDMKNMAALQQEVHHAFTATLVKYEIDIELIDVKFTKMVMQ